jgi:hypothetical protein
MRNEEMILFPKYFVIHLGVQPLMLGKMTIKGFEFIKIDFKPCPYQILTSTSGSKKVQGLTKHEVVIQVNPKKLAYYTTMWV